MKRWINFAQWLALVALAAGVVWMVVKPPPPVDYAPETWSNWDGFMAISYAGVSRNDSSLYPSSKTLAGHFEALQAAGYHTVTPDDALAFLERREPLPSKAVLILLEGARKETFIRAHPVLSRLGMRATLCVPTESLMNWDESKLKERDVGKIAGMPQWSLASMGNEAPNPIVVSAQKKTDHFLSKRQWLRKLDREENDGEFRQRVAGDYQESSAILKKINGAPVVAYVYPYSDNGFRADADPLAGAINNSCLASNYSLAFVSASNPFNPPGRNPYSLSRLRISGDWTAAQVLTQLKQAQPRPWPSVVDVEGSGRWMLRDGAHLVKDSLRLDSGDAAWVKGSDFWTDAEIGVSLTRGVGGVAVCYIRFDDPANCLRLTVGDKDIRLQETRHGTPVTVAVAPAPDGEVIQLLWRVKGNRSWLVLNGRPVFGPVPLAEWCVSGMIGFESNHGRLAFSGLAIKPLLRQGLIADSWITLPASRRMDITEYLPRFPAPGRELSVQQRMDFIQAVAEGASVWPILKFATNGPAPQAQVEALSAVLAKDDMRPFIKGFVLDSSLSEWSGLLRDRGFMVMHRVKAGQMVPLSATNLVDYVWLEGTGTNVLAAAKKILHRHPPSQLMVQDGTVVRNFIGVGQITE